MSLTKKYTCGSTFPSGCVTYTADLPGFISEDDVSCDANLDEIFVKYGITVDALLDSNDFTGLDKKNFSFNPATVKAKELHQEEITKIFDLRTELDSLTTSFNNLNIGSKLITLNLGCLTPAAAPCAVASNTYTLISILQLLAAEICLLKNA